MFYGLRECFELGVRLAEVDTTCPDCGGFGGYWVFPPDGNIFRAGELPVCERCGGCGVIPVMEAWVLSDPGVILSVVCGLAEWDRSLRAEMLVLEG